MMATSPVRINKSGQVAIPPEIRKKLNIKAGDLVTFVETENGVLIKPVGTAVTEMLDVLNQTPILWEIVKAFKNGMLTEEQIRRILKETQ
jgi:AbrB family looped-hinge helix DNA binding protein